MLYPDIRLMSIRCSADEGVKASFFYTVIYTLIYTLTPKNCIEYITSDVIYSMQFFFPAFNCLVV